MLISLHKMRGMTLIELMVAVVIFGLLMSLGISSFSTWIQNQQTRTASESILNGLQLARNEAVKRNAPTIFVMCDLNAGGTGSSWDVLANTASAAQGNAQACQPDSGAVTQWERVQQRPAQEGSRNVIVTPTPAGLNAIAFNGFGRVIILAPTGLMPLPAAPNPLVQNLTPRFDMSNSRLANGRNLRVTVISSGTTRMCDPSPQLAANDPRAC
ncbi:MAG TPA: GspH/FimT family pseudopilin [Gallionellaceae bacterium]